MGIADELSNYQTNLELKGEDPKTRRIADLEDQITDLEADKEEMRAEISRMETAYAQVIMDLRSEISRLQNQSMQNIRATRTAEEERDNALRQVEEATAALAELRASSGTSQAPVS